MSLIHPSVNLIYNPSFSYSENQLQLRVFQDKVLGTFKNSICFIDNDQIKVPYLYHPSHHPYNAEFNVMRDTIMVIFTK